MFNLQKTKNLMLYSLISFCFTAYPALAQGEKIVEDEQTMQLMINIVTGASVLMTGLAFIHCILTRHLALANSDRSVITSNLLISSVLIVIILLISFVIEQFLPIFVYAIAVNCISIILGLITRLTVF